MTGWLENFHKYTGKSAIILAFILCALPVGIMTALVTPRGQSPDELAHMIRADGLLHGAVLGVRKSDIDPYTGQKELIAGVKADESLVHDFDLTTPIDGRPVLTTQDFLAFRALPATHHIVFLKIPNTVTYFPAVYLPATLALAIAWMVHAPPYIALLLARCATLLGFLALGSLALALTAYGEALLLTVLLLPMTLFLAGTVNEDSILIGLTCLACACLTRGTRASRRGGLALFALVLACKPPYAIMLGTFLLPLRGPGLCGRVRDAAIVCIPVVIWVGLVLALVAVPFDRPPYHPGPLYTGDRSVLMDHTNTAISLHLLLSPPTRLVTLPAQTLAHWLRGMLRMMVGVLGALQIPLPSAYEGAWGICLATSAIGLLGTRRPLASFAAAGLNFAFVVMLMITSFWLMMIVFYLDWTEVGMDSVQGLQGRYWLPYLPFFLFAIPALRLRSTLPPLLPALPTIALGLYDLGYIPMKLVWNYYLH